MEDRYSKRAVGARLKEFRLSLGQTQKQFAEQMNWDVNTYRKIETGASLLTSDKAQMLYDKFEIDITTADRVERKQLIGELLSYIETLL